MRTLLFLPALALVACGTDSGSSSSGDAPPRVDQTVEVSVEACDVLTASMVAAALGVPEPDVALNQENIDENVERGYMDEGAFCKYDLPRGGDYSAATVIVAGYESASGAEGMFASTYRTKTEEEIAQIEGATNRAADQLRAEGSEEIGALDDLEGEQADVGGMFAGLASKITYEDVPGVGDEAALETSRIVDPPQLGAIHIRDGAVVYSVAVSPEYVFSQQESSFDEIRDRTLELGRLVAAAR